MPQTGCNTGSAGAGLRSPAALKPSPVTQNSAREMLSPCCRFRKGRTCSCRANRSARSVLSQSHTLAVVGCTRVLQRNIISLWPLPSFMSINPVEQLASAPSTIMIVDDEVLIRFAVADYLRECGYHVVEAASGDEALALLQSSETPRIGLVFSDVQMPGTIDGFALARWVREHRSGLPVILTSGAARTADLAEELCEIGPVEQKPYDAKSLHSRIQKMLGVERGAR